MKKKIKVLELFGGISAPHKALTNLGFDVETVDYVEFDEKVVSVRNAIYGTDFKPQSVVDYHCNKEVDLLIGGSPCQDFSIAGLNNGGDKNSETRSSLMWEQLRIIKETMPKVTIWENVKNTLSEKHIHNFESYMEELENYGYTNYYKVLNSKNFGNAQNRERVFLVSVKKDAGIDFSFENLEVDNSKELKDFIDEFRETGNVPEKMVELFNANEYTINSKGVLHIPHSSYDADCRVQDVSFKGKLSPTLTSKGANSAIKILQDEKIREITICERFKLMGFDESDYEKTINNGHGDSILKYVTGNSIVVNVLEAIFKELFGGI